jgi:hypothetical protein
VLHSALGLLQVGGLIKRLDTGEGSYAKELEEDYDVADQLDQVCLLSFAWSIAFCSASFLLPVDRRSSCSLLSVMSTMQPAPIVFVWDPTAGGAGWVHELS